jgi:hypothetical protein
MCVGESYQKTPSTFIRKNLWWFSRREKLKDPSWDTVRMAVKGYGEPEIVIITREEARGIVPQKKYFPQ